MGFETGKGIVVCLLSWCCVMLVGNIHIDGIAREWVAVACCTSTQS